MKKILNNAYLTSLLYIFYFLVIAIKWRKIDAQVVGLAVGTLISPFVIMLLIRTYKKVNKKEFLGGLAIIGLIFGLADLIGLIGTINFVSIIALPFLMVRWICLRITESKQI